MDEDQKFAIKSSLRCFVEPMTAKRRVSTPATLEPKVPARRYFHHCYHHSLNYYHRHHNFLKTQNNCGMAIFISISYPSLSRYCRCWYFNYLWKHGTLSPSSSSRCWQYRLFQGTSLPFDAFDIEIQMRFPRLLTLSWAWLCGRPIPPELEMPFNRIDLTFKWFSNTLQFWSDWT